MPRMTASTVPASPQDGFVEACVEGRTWRLSRPADLESLWDSLGQDQFGDDERLPYWVELWPAAVLLARFIAQNPQAVAGRACLDAGCGLGLPALVAAAAGARVLAFDYEPEALVHARRNAALNLLPDEAAPVFTVMDWRMPAVAKGGAEVILGADILYERRFFEPVAAFLEYALAPGGRVFIADPERAVSAGAAGRLEAKGWRVTTALSSKVAQSGQNMTVHLLEITRSGDQLHSKKEG
jgi:predicted nicotinamide N-methyase